MDPRLLCESVWFHVTSKFCLRGGEVQKLLTKSDLVKSTVDGKEVYNLATAFMTKNHQGSLVGSNHVSAGCIQDPVQVAAIDLYLSKLHPNLDRLFQRARVPAGTAAVALDSVWYCNSPLSHNLLNQFMKRISEQAGLSCLYTSGL